MKHSITRSIISAAAAAAPGCSLFTDTALALSDGSLQYEPICAGSELVDVIVRLNGNAVLAAPEASGQGADYIDTASARKAEDSLRKAQDTAEDHIRRLYPELKIKRRFTLTANGFSCSLPGSIISVIEADPLVESVTEIKADIAALPELADARELGGVNSFSSSSGLTGEGEVIAVIDTEFDVTHDMFAPMTDREARITKDDVFAISSKAGFSSKLSADKVYISNKVPFAYDYSDDTPYTLDEIEYYHGTHVSGIAAGNRITTADGTEISGAAPDAQLLMMKVYGTDGVTEEAVAAAVEDAVKLRADVINMSFGRVYEYYDNLLYADSIAAAANAGIMLCSSAGNNSNDGSGIGKLTSVRNVDTGCITEPALFPQVLSAASADAPDGTISRFSSYGVGTSLDLKPEITAIGGNVLSAGYNNSTERMSGTSMAAPFISGCAALCDQMLKAQGSELTGIERTQRIKNILMNSAVPHTESGSLLSPRRQGAGLAALDKAANDKVIMTGESGEADIELRDGLGDSFSFALNITNISGEDVTFTSSDIALTTDGFSVNTSTGKHFIAGQTALRTEDDFAGEITVPARQTVTRTVNVTLDPEQTSQLAAVFTNGFFVEGFISLSGAGNCCDISIPLIGFRGDWCKVPTIDTETYPLIPKSSIGETELRTDISFARTADMLRGIVMNDSYLLSLDAEDIDSFPITAEASFNEEQAEQFSSLNDGVSYISPNGDVFADRFGCYYMPLREAVFSGIDVIGSDGATLCRTHTEPVNSNIAQLALIPEETYSLPDGRYSCRIDSYIRYGAGADNKQTYPLEIAVDTEAPEVGYSISKEDGRTFLHLTAKDSALDGIYIMGTMGGETTVESTASFNALALAQRTLSYDSYAGSALIGTEKRINSAASAGTLPDGLSDIHSVLTGKIKPKNYYNYCKIIPAEPDENGTFSTSLDITGLGEYTICVLDRAFNVSDIHSDHSMPADFKKGIWKLTTEYYSSFFCFQDGGKLLISPTTSHSVAESDYKLDGKRLSYLQQGSIYPDTAVVEWIDEDNAVLKLGNSGLHGQLRFITEGSLWDYRFYSDNDLIEFARRYYYDLHGTFPNAWIDTYSSQETVKITLYEYIDETETTLAVYTVDRDTATGVDENGEPVDIRQTARFSTDGVWSACTPTDSIGELRYFKFTELSEDSGEGVCVYQADGIEHSFTCTFAGEKVTFSFDSYESTGTPSREAEMEYLTNDKLELRWDNGCVEELTHLRKTGSVSELGFLTNDTLIELTRSHFTERSGIVPDEIIPGYNGEADTAVLRIYKTSEGGAGVCIGEYTVNVFDGTGYSNEYPEVDLLNDLSGGIKLGDVNGDGMIDAKDSSQILVYYSRISTGMVEELPPDKYIAADANIDKMVDANDASLILAYYSFTSTGGLTSGIKGYLDLINSNG